MGDPNIEDWIASELLRIHGNGLCHICGKPKAEEGGSICSYPHGMLPEANPEAPFPTWKLPDR